MDKTKLERLISENMKSVLGFALTRLGNVNEAEELASDIFYRLIRSSENLRDEERFYGFMWKIAENAYIDHIRRNSKTANLTAELDEDIQDLSDTAEDRLEMNEELNLLRRELSLLSKQYREATVLYYMGNFSCSEVAKKLQISTEMVKYYLFRARKMIREGMSMEREFGEKSYCPCSFRIDFWGTNGGEDREYIDFRERKIKGNILLAAYYCPVTIQEISIELGVAVPYLEDEIRLLVDRQYLVSNNGKYLTNIPVFPFECTEKINGKLKELTENAAEKYIEISDRFLERFGDRFANENLARWQKLLLCLHWSLNETENDIEKNYGELPENGPYSLVNGGGGKGIIWGESLESSVGEALPKKIRGIYNNLPTDDGRGSVIAINFAQTLNSQHFMSYLTEGIVLAAEDGFERVTEEDVKNYIQKHKYVRNGKANFSVWTTAEYEELKEILAGCISIVSELNRKTIEIAAKVTADFAPQHIRKTAEYAGAIVYRFNAVENLVNRLFEMNWLKKTDDNEKPAICVVL